MIGGIGPIESLVLSLPFVIVLIIILYILSLVNRVVKAIETIADSISKREQSES